MSRKNYDLQKWLQTDDIYKDDEKDINDLISKGIKYMESPEFNNNSFLNILFSQLQYMTLSFWAIQFGFLVVIIVTLCLLGHLKVQFYYPFTLFSIIIPLIVLIGVKELSKSYTYNMWEIEQSSRFHPEKITICRMLIIGMVDLFIVTTVLAVMSHYYQYSIIRMILYVMVPFNICCISYFFVVRKVEKSDSSYYLIASMICLSIAFYFLMRQQILFEISMIWIWCASYLVTVIFLSNAVKKYLKYEKMIGELSWNLQ